MTLRISDIRLFAAPLGGQLLVKVETDRGPFGWGEVTLGQSRGLAVQGLLRHYREFLVGRDPLQRGRLWQEVYRSDYAEGGVVVGSVLGAVDVALHDIAGKHLGVPVYQLLGGAQREYVPLFGTTSAMTGPEMLEQAERLVAGGWRAVRLVLLKTEAPDGPPVFEPRESLAETAEWVGRIRAALGHDIAIGLEYHHRLSVAETASFCQMLEPGALDFLEEPIRAQNPAAYAALRRLTNVPLAVGEEFASKWDFRPYLERGLVNFARTDVGTVGGFTEAMKVAGWAETHYVDVMPHNAGGAVGTAAAAHFAMAIPNFSWLEYRESPAEPSGRFYDPAVYPVQPRVEGAQLHVSDGPGLGVTVDESTLSTTVPTPTGEERFHLRRSDGSVTNW